MDQQEFAIKAAMQKVMDANLTKGMKQAIGITGKNLNDIFALPCVRPIMKRDDGTFVFKVKLKPRTYEIAHVGDTLVEMEDGTWLIDP